MSEATSASTAAGFKWGTSAISLTSTRTATAGISPFSAALSGLAPATTYYYQAYATVHGTEDHASETATFYGDVKSFTTLDYSATVTTGGASEITPSGAVIAASFSGANAQPRETRIIYGTSASSLTNTAYYDGGGLSAPSGNYSVTLSSLSPNTTYYYKAVVQIGTKDFEGSVRSFKTAEQTSFSVRDWLELPAISGNEDHVGTFKSGSKRNYTYNYNYDNYTALWVAYPLYSSTMGGSRSGGWAANPKIATDKQINIRSGSYGVNVGSTTTEGYTTSKNYYSRGHQIPDADRNNESTMQDQTYYATNSTPQIQNKFNGGIWNGLENAVRTVASNTDTLYVVTGASFRKVGGSETIVKITPAHDSKQVPVPNYYWKVLLKVKRTNGGNITSASAVGVWIDHREHDDNYSNYIVTVDQIEAWTGFDFFAALPSSLQTAAEQNSNWSTFANF